MKTVCFSTKLFERNAFQSANLLYKHELTFIESYLNYNTATLANGFPAICAFVTDELNANVLTILAKQGTKLIALRSAGFNHVDLTAAKKLGLTVVRVPAYSPYAIAEHTIGLILALNRNIHKSYARVREGNFALDGLLGFDIHGKKVGIIGTGKIGAVVAHIIKGFGCNLLGYDVSPNPVCIELGMKYVNLPELFSESDIITLHCPLTPETHHLINAKTLEKMKDGVMIINTSRGATIDTKAAISGLKSGKIGYLGLDVYEEETDLFFQDLSSHIIQDDIFMRLLTFPNVLITGHQAFLTKEALENIAKTTLANITDCEFGRTFPNEVKAELFIK